jgi:type IV secretory pathway ATPase VirB11/archaellum biosynthesis ATPase
MDLLERFQGGGDGDGDHPNGCGCEVELVDAPSTPGRDRRSRLRVETGECPGDGDLRTEPGCRATVVGTLAERDAAVVTVRSAGVERRYRGAGAGLLLAAGRFVERAAVHDEALAERARRDPLGAARAATGRAGPVADVAATTGLAEAVARLDGYDDLTPLVGPTIAGTLVQPRSPPDSELVDRWRLGTGATVRLYDGPDGQTYHLEPPWRSFERAGQRALATAADRLAAGSVDGGERAPWRAARRVTDGTVDVEAVADVLERHTRGHGTLEHPLSDPRVSDVFVSAPVAKNPVRVAVDDERVRTNVHVTPAGAAALASRLRRASGRPFSRATPTIDAVVETVATDEPVRVAGVASPASDGLGFAFRSHGRAAWTLPALVSVGTLPAEAAALLSVATQRGAAVLVAGPRGAGKTTTLGALLFELPGDVRTVVVEDTLELPVETLRAAGRDVQPLRTDTGDGAEPTPTEAVRTALRLGRGALVVGEVRGEEARALYEAMRVGASESAVLGTIHGESAAAVRERVVSDLGVPVSSFAATDLVVTLTVGRQRRLSDIEEVRRTDDGVSFASLVESAPSDEDVPRAGPVERGNSHLVEALARTDESYADVLAALEERTDLLSSLARTDRTDPAEVTAAYREADRP